jgi:hypothetical protein
MEIILKADKLLNGNYHLLNHIFSYLGQSPSAKVIDELINDNEMNEEINGRLYFTNHSPLYPSVYFTMRNWSNNSLVYKCKKYTPLFIPRFKVDILHIEDDVDCERCNKLMTYPEREFYKEYCEMCYGKTYKMGRESDEENDTESETDED